jgi:hypothetical protein
MIAQGVAEAVFLAGALYLVVSIRPPDVVFASVLVVLGAGLGVLMIFAGLNTLAYQKRSRSLLLLLLNVSMLFTVWCAPTALLLSLFGLFVLTRNDVVDAFERSDSRALS